MNDQKPSLPKGTRDFGPGQMIKRNFILSTIKRTFEKFGYVPLETPSMENLSVLTGKYGDEGDQLLYKILNSGDFLSKTTLQDYEQGAKALLPKISGKGLRYDLTVPFARYVAMNRHQLTFPFKRYQIQPVWRADRPQKGRYREFYQCDADAVGTDSLICEAEIVLMIQETFQKLGIKDFTIKINHRKILSGLVEVLGEKDEGAFAVAIDKLDKIGLDKVLEELQGKGFSEESLSILRSILGLQVGSAEKLTTLKNRLKDSENGMKGIAEVEKVLQYLKTFGVKAPVIYDLTLARGLSYYTGAIFEVKVNNVSIGSVSGGGRYDNLTGIFGLPDVSGVGFSFGVDRIYDVMEELDIFPEENRVSTQIMITNFDNETETYALRILSKLRAENINSEIYPDQTKLKKQLNYADKKSIPYVLVVGPEEVKSGNLTLKNMKTGSQETMDLTSVMELVK